MRYFCVEINGERRFDLETTSQDFASCHAYHIWLKRKFPGQSIIVNKPGSAYFRRRWGEEDLGESRVVSSSVANPSTGVREADDGEYSDEERHEINSCEDDFPRSAANQRPLGRLLEEISWEGGKCTRFRQAGRGLENVLTTEVFQSIDLLPRSLFLAKIIENCKGGATVARQKLIADAENVRITVLPGNTYLCPTQQNFASRIGVQPDVLIESQNIYCFVEAKRIKGQPSFQPEQLARQFVVACRDAGDRVPILLLVLPGAPPVKIGRYHKEVYDAIADELDIVVQKTEGLAITAEGLNKVIDKSVIWTTWESIASVIADETTRLSDDASPVISTIQRVARYATNAIQWHC